MYRTTNYAISQQLSVLAQHSPSQPKHLICMLSYALRARHNNHNLIFLVRQLAEDLDNLLFRVLIGYLLIFTIPIYPVQ